MFPTSLPGAIFGGITAARPTSPRAASRASVGISAASSGVRPPSASRGSSAQPSGTQITYFTGSVSQVSLVRPHPGLRPPGGRHGLRAGADEAGDDGLEALVVLERGGVTVERGHEDDLERVVPQ